MFVPVIMAGGSGTRLWPLSRQLNPKQFLPLVDADSTMLQATLKRLEGLDQSMPVLICNEHHRFLAAEQLRQVGMEQATIILEPVGRNTAPAIALAAMQATRDGADPIMLVLAADHLIKDVAAFQASVLIALNLVDFGPKASTDSLRIQPGMILIRRDNDLTLGNEFPESLRIHFFL